MRQFHRVLLVTAWLSVCGAASDLAYGAPAKTKNLADAKIIAALGRHAEILIDSTGGLSINDVSGPGCAGRFRPQGAAVPNLGITSAAVWVRFTVKNLTFTEDWILKAAPPGMDEVELYSGEGSDWEVLELGRKLPFSARPIPNANLLFPLNLPLGKEATFYLRYANGMGMTLPLRL